MTGAIVVAYFLIHSTLGLKNSSFLASSPPVPFAASAERCVSLPMP